MIIASVTPCRGSLEFCIVISSICYTVYESPRPQAVGKKHRLRPCVDEVLGHLFEIIEYTTVDYVRVTSVSINRRNRTKLVEKPKNVGFDSRKPCQKC